MEALDTNWLSVELDSVESNMEYWGGGLKASYESLFRSEEYQGAASPVHIRTEPSN